MGSMSLTMSWDRINDSGGGANGAPPSRTRRLLAQGPDIVPIPGTKHVRYLEENAAAADLALSPADLARIEEAVPKGSVAGDRYGPAARALVDR